MNSYNLCNWYLSFSAEFHTFCNSGQFCKRRSKSAAHVLLVRIGKAHLRRSSVSSLMIRELSLCCIKCISGLKSAALCSLKKNPNARFVGNIPFTGKPSKKSSTMRNRQAIENASHANGRKSIRLFRSSMRCWSKIRRLPKKQRHTIKRIFDRLRKHHNYPGGITVVGDIVTHATPAEYFSDTDRGAPEMGSLNHVL